MIGGCFPRNYASSLQLDIPLKILVCVDIYIYIHIVLVIFIGSLVASSTALPPDSHLYLQPCVLRISADLSGKCYRTVNNWVIIFPTYTAVSTILFLRSEALTLVLMCIEWTNSFMPILTDLSGSGYRAVHD